MFAVIFFLAYKVINDKNMYCNFKCDNRMMGPRKLHSQKCNFFALFCDN